MFLTCSHIGVYSHPSHLDRRERYLGRFGTWRWERRLRAGANVARALGRPRVSVRPERVCHCELAGRGQASGAKSPCSEAAKSPEERTEAKKSPRRNVERRCRVPLFPGDPGSKPRLLPRCAFRRPVSPQKGEKKSKAQLALRREDGRAWLFEIRIRKIIARRRKHNRHRPA